MSKKTELYDKITDTVIKKLEQGIVPWQRPFINGLPHNINSDKPYRGINLIYLSCLDYEDSRYLTITEIKKRKFWIKKGEKSHPIVFWDRITITDKETNEKKTIPFLKHYNVWNVEQLDHDLEPENTTVDNKPIENIENDISAFLHFSKIAFEHKNCTPHYIPMLDKIELPKIDKAINSYEFYNTLWHEIIHATGHETRLDRNLTGMKGSDSYAFEELTAELGACFKCSDYGIHQEVIDNSSAYLQSWIKRLRDDKSLLFKASTQARKACEYIDKAIDQKTA